MSGRLLDLLIIPANSAALFKFFPPLARRCSNWLEVSGGPGVISSLSVLSEIPVLRRLFGTTIDSSCSLNSTSIGEVLIGEIILGSRRCPIGVEVSMLFFLLRGFIYLQKDKSLGSSAVVFCRLFATGTSDRIDLELINSSIFFLNCCLSRSSFFKSLSLRLSFATETNLQISLELNSSRLFKVPFSIMWRPSLICLLSAS